MGSRERNRYLIGFSGAAVTVIALLILPFAGFTEKTTYWISFEITGLGTWGDGLVLFSYPATLFYTSMLLLVGVVALIGPLRLLWSAYRHRQTPSADRLRRAAVSSAAVSVGAIVVLLLTMLVLLPSVEEETIWAVERAGFLTEWWPGWGAFVAIGGAGIVYWALRGLGGSPTPVPAPPPTE